MPYSRKKSSGGRRSYSSSRRASGRKSGPVRRKATRARQPQTIKLVIETAPSSAVSRPDLPAGTFMVEQRKGKAKL